MKYFNWCLTCNESYVTVNYFYDFVISIINLIIFWEIGPMFTCLSGYAFASKQEEGIGQEDFSNSFSQIILNP